MSTERSALLPSDQLLLRRHIHSKPSPTSIPNDSSSAPLSQFSPLLSSSVDHHDPSSAPIPSINANHVSFYSRLKCAGHKAKTETHRFLVSKGGHYAVLALVTADVCCIFAEFLVSLYRCEEFCCGKLDGPKDHGEKQGIKVLSTSVEAMLRGGKLSLMGERGREETWSSAQDALGAVSVAFSCLFMLELLASLWGFGIGEFFKSKFHTFDAIVILLSFVLDVCLKGVLEEVGSIVVVLRLWRVFKIIEELGAGVEDREERWEEMWGEQLTELRKENAELKEQLEDMRALNDDMHNGRNGEA